MNTRKGKWITYFFLVGLAVALTVGIGCAQGAGGWVSVQGTLAQYAPAAGNQVNTFFLDDGSEIHFPAQFYSQIGNIVKKGDQVKVTGWIYIGPVGDVHIYASTITNPTSGSTVTITINPTSTAPYPPALAAAYSPSAAYQPAAEPPTVTGVAPLTAPSSGVSVPTAVPSTGYQPGLPVEYAPAPSALPEPPAPPPGPLGTAAPIPPLAVPPAPLAPPPGPLGAAAPTPPLAAPPASGIPGVGAPAAAFTQESTLSGVVRGFMHGPAGEVRGFLLLTDGGTTVVVQVLPEISPWITTVAAMGSSVKVTGWMNIGPAGERTFVATSIQNVKTGQTVGSVSTQTTGGYSR